MTQSEILFLQRRNWLMFAGLWWNLITASSLQDSDILSYFSEAINYMADFYFVNSIV